MRKLMNLVRGMVTIRVEGLFPERLINLCAQENIDFWAMEWLDEHTVRFVARRRALSRLAVLSQRLAVRWSGRPAGDCRISSSGSVPGTPFWQAWSSPCAQLVFSPVLCLPLR